MHWDDNFYSTHFFMFFTLSCSFKVTLLSAIGGGSYFPVTTTKSIFIFNENNLFCAYCGRYFYERERMRSETIVFNYMWKRNTSWWWYNFFRRLVRKKKTFANSKLSLNTTFVPLALHLMLIMWIVSVNSTSLDCLKWIEFESMNKSFEKDKFDV